MDFAFLWNFHLHFYGFSFATFGIFILQQTSISQEKLALLAELDRTYITSVERGKRNISIINLEKIAKALNVKMGAFFD